MDKKKRFFHNWAWLIFIFFCIIGLINPSIGLVALICMLAPVLIAFARGRMWCGNFCPRGSFYDNLLAKISWKKKIPRVFRSLWLKILFLILLMGAFAIQLIFAWGNIPAVGMVFVRMILITTAIAIVLGVVFRQRAWCLICPMGTMAHLVTKHAALNSQIKYATFNKEKCVDCKSCSRACPLEIDVLSHKNEGKVTNADCLKCNVCVNKCPKKSIKIA
ncbi:MAG TPA: 4Fe-4S binding protein [Desulfitobacteriaceae bacterium]|nr:4Fe-4S binding protein [Desulfitobacteriaceae bacterium]